MRPEPDDLELERSIRALADAFERGASPEEAVVADIQGRLRAGGRRLALGAVGVAVVVVAAAIGLRALIQAPVGGPVAMPEIAGLFVTQSPDADGRCYAVRLYDTTPTDGRVSLWTWAGVSGCAARSDNLATGVGRAAGVGLPSDVGVAIDAAEGAPSALEGVHLVLRPDATPDGPLRAFPSVEAAAAGEDGIRMESVDTLEIPYRPG
jgi:hypothetical protein